MLACRRRCRCLYASGTSAHPRGAAPTSQAISYPTALVRGIPYVIAQSCSVPAPDEHGIIDGATGLRQSRWHLPEEAICPSISSGGRYYLRALLLSRGRGRPCGDFTGAFRRTSIDFSLTRSACQESCRHCRGAISCRVRRLLLLQAIRLPPVLCAPTPSTPIPTDSLRAWPTSRLLAAICRCITCDRPMDKSHRSSSSAWKFSACTSGSRIYPPG
jgi:hypothetical protein